PMINSCHHEAKCKYCFEKMGGIPANMLQYLKEDCSKISKEIRDTLHSFVNRNISQNEATAIHCQLLHALLSANVPFSFVDNSEVIKLFRMLQPSYNLSSRKWISIEILDQIGFVSDSGSDMVKAQRLMRQ
ncbi:2077_t:CDS:2, partial [Funneliformis mosseae]